MKTKPILMRNDLVESTLSGHKTQTLRIVDRAAALDMFTKRAPKICPYGQAGDRLWIRENFWDWGIWSKMGNHKKWISHADQEHPIRFLKPDSADRNVSMFRVGYALRPSIYLPKSACRAVVTITGTQLLQLYCMNNDQALKEGIRPNADGTFPNFQIPGLPFQKPIDSFISLWKAIHGTWDKWTFIWRIQFQLSDGYPDFPNAKIQK